MYRIVPATLLLLAAFLAALPSRDAQAQDKTPAKVKGQLPPKWKLIEPPLSKEQIAKLYAVQAEHKAKVMKLEEEIKAIRQAEATAMRELLTAPQKASLAKLLLGDDAPKKEEPKKDK